jgi:hypothetical protein
VALEGLGFHLGAALVPHLAKQAAIAVQEFLVHRGPVLHVFVLDVRGIFSRKQDIILHRAAKPPKTLASAGTKRTVSGGGNLWSLVGLVIAFAGVTLQRCHVR